MVGLISLLMNRIRRDRGLSFKVPKPFSVSALFLRLSRTMLYRSEIKTTTDESKIVVIIFCPSSNYKALVLYSMECL